MQAPEIIAELNDRAQHLLNLRSLGRPDRVAEREMRRDCRLIRAAVGAIEGVMEADYE